MFMLGQVLSDLIYMKGNARAIAEKNRNNMLQGIYFLYCFCLIELIVTQNHDKVTDLEQRQLKTQN